MRLFFSKRKQIKVIALYLVLLLTLSTTAFAMVDIGAEAYDMLGEWEYVSGRGYKGTVKVTEQSGSDFTGTISINSSNVESLPDGKISGNTITFTRLWSSGMGQAYNGTFSVSNGIATISGNFTGLGGSDTFVMTKKVSQITPAPTPTPSTPTIPSSIIDMRGIWDTKHNRDVYSGTLNVQNQDGNEFTGEINIDGSRIEKLTEGSIEGNVMKFTRQWSGGGLWQDYVGTITIDANGYIRVEGTFTQSGGSTIYDWWAIKRDPVSYLGESGTTPPVEPPAPPVEPIQPIQPPTPQTGDTRGEAFESGARLMWPSAQNILGYRLYRSENQGQLGVSVTDFYITSTSYADVNVKPSTTYYYSVKPVLAEADPFNDIEEKLGDVIATFVITTGSEIIYKPDSTKHFIMLKLDSPYMSVDGENREVDPGRGTCPIIIAGRTMVPIRAVVEAMNGTVGWDQGTKLITLNARGNKVEMWLDKTDIKVNGVAKEMDIAPVARDGRTYVPVRFAAENLNCKVDWINSTKEAIIVYEE